jgi:hypothetical protein
VAVVGSKVRDRGNRHIGPVSKSIMLSVGFCGELKF